MPDIFISYSSKDRAHANALVERLRSNGFDVWIDQTGIDGADSWSKEIAKALEDSTVFLLLLSQNALASRNVAKELSVAAELSKPILPILIERVKLQGEFLYHLTSLQRIHYDNTDAIIRSLHKHIGNVSSIPPPSPQNTNAVSSIRLAVLPFEDTSPAQNNSWFADGMMNELITKLGSIKDISVAPRSDVIYYKKYKPDPLEIVNDLNIRYIVDGSVQKVENKVRINVSLSDAKERRMLWSNNYVGTFDDVFTLQQRTSFSIAEALKVRLQPEEKFSIEEKPTENTEAYELYLRGSEYYALYTRADMHHSLTLYHNAVELDPTFVWAYTSIAIVNFELYRSYERNNKYLLDGKQAIDNIEAISGRSDSWNMLMSKYSLIQNRSKESVEFAERAVELNPTNTLALEMLGLAYRLTGDITKEVQTWERSLEVIPNSLNTLFNYLIALKMLGDDERLRQAALKAIAPYRKHLRLTPDDYNSAVLYGNILRYANEYESAYTAADELSRAELDGVALYNLACLFIALGYRERGFATLVRAVDKGYIDLESFKHDPDLDPVRQTNEFKELTAFVERSIRSD
jgi:TolB-like protein